MTERTIEGTPSALPTMLKAALPALPGVNLIPGIAKKGGALPDLRLTRRDVAIDPDHVATYAEVCGFAPSQALPLTYPHMLAFGLHMGIMTDGSFPFPAIGTVHLANSITQHRPLSPAERLDVSASAVNSFTEANSGRLQSPAHTPVSGRWHSHRSSPLLSQSQACSRVPRLSLRVLIGKRSCVPLRRAAQFACTGHSRHCGERARQIVAPRSMMPCV